VLALGNSGTGKTHIALAIWLAACQKGYRVRFTTAASQRAADADSNPDRAVAAAAAQVCDVCAAKRAAGKPLISRTSAKADTRRAFALLENVFAQPVIQSSLLFYRSSA
jgi:hypothetical protein